MSARAYVLLVFVLSSDKVCYAFIATRVVHFLVLVLGQHGGITAWGEGFSMGRRVIGKTFVLNNCIVTGEQRPEQGNTAAPPPTPTLPKASHGGGEGEGRGGELS